MEEAQIHTNELVSEHEIMQQAYAQANDIVTAATEQAQEILDNATMMQMISELVRCSTQTILCRTWKILSGIL